MPSRQLKQPIALVDRYRLDAIRQLDQAERAKLGQFMTPAPVAKFMASLFDKLDGQTIHLLDAGAGIGSLTTAVIEAICSQTNHPDKIQATLYEIAPRLVTY